MSSSILKKYKIYEDMKAYVPFMQQDKKHLKFLTDEPDRFDNYSLSGGGLFFDFSRQRIDQAVMRMLFDLSREADLAGHFFDMTHGKVVNPTEKRSALHTATRSFSPSPLMVNGEDVRANHAAIRKQIQTFSEKVHSGTLKGSTGKHFKHLVVVGIGGSYLGTMFVSKALDAFKRDNMHLYFLSNVDIHNFAEITQKIEPESTLFIIISKSYTTTETMANVNQVIAYMKQKGLDPDRHMVSVTSKGSPGDQKASPFIETFHMFDSIGGRYSVTSAVGGVPLSLYLGYDIFEQFLKGAEAMDLHAEKAPCESNLPMIAALISVWNNSFLNYPQGAIIPYATPLKNLPGHIQQLNMESNGKSVDIHGNPLDDPAGVILFGETGTNAQHSFFQLAHQGSAFPIDFIGVITPQYPSFNEQSKGVTNHQELWANMIAQARALARGKKGETPERTFSGNRPSSTLLLNDLSPESVGALLSFYEAKTVFEAFIWGINPFDQFGVELGKVMAGTIREELARKNKDPDYRFQSDDPITKWYLKRLCNGTINAIEPDESG